MRLKDFVKEFWKDNKIDYLIVCIIFSISGFIVYAITEPSYKIENYFLLLPLFLMGMYILGLLFAFLIYWRNN